MIDLKFQRSIGIHTDTSRLRVTISTFKQGQKHRTKEEQWGTAQNSVHAKDLRITETTSKGSVTNLEQATVESSKTQKSTNSYNGFQN
jgi:hypothetical protein